MSEESKIAAIRADSHVTSVDNLPKEIQNLPEDMRTVVSVMAGIFRSSSGPDPETAKIMADAEMHEESCKLEAYKQSMKNRDLQGERDQQFRMKKLGYDNIKSLLIGLSSIGGIIFGLYLTVKLGNSAVGNPVMLASFLALLGVKPNLQTKDKD